MAIAGVFKSRATLIAENLCLRQQLLVYQRRRPRPRLRDADRRFWILARRWFSGWRGTLLVARPETVLGWHRKGWKAYWRWKSERAGEGRSKPDPGRAQIAYPTHGLAECLVGSAEDPSGADEARLQSLGPNRCQVQAPAARSRTVARLALLSRTPRRGDLGL